jgi:hypothetical protein
MTAMTYASLMTESFSRRSFSIAAAFTPGMFLPYNDGSATNIVAAFGETVLVVTSNPVTGDVCSIPGIFRAMSLTCRTTSSVRARLEPGGSWTTTTR